MIPEEFINFSKRFDIGFLVWIKANSPFMARSNFRITKENIKVAPINSEIKSEMISVSKVSLIFSNPYYAEKCEMGIVKGELMKIRDELLIEPINVTWSIAFDVNNYPDRIVERWKKK